MILFILQSVKIVNGTARWWCWWWASGYCVSVLLNGFAILAVVNISMYHSLDYLKIGSDRENEKAAKVRHAYESGLLSTIVLLLVIGRLSFFKNCIGIFFTFAASDSYTNVHNVLKLYDIGRVSTINSTQTRAQTHKNHKNSKQSKIYYY